MDKIMLLDDEPMILKALQRLFHRGTDWEIECFQDPREALKRAQTGIYELFIVDYKMPYMDGIEFLTQVQQVQPQSQRILLTGQADVESALKAINQANVFRFITKPWNDDELMDSVKKALHYHSVLQRNMYLSKQLGVLKEDLESAILDHSEDGALVDAVQKIVAKIKL